jgi:hypothetical protein
MNLVSKQPLKTPPATRTCRIISKKSRKVLSFSTDSETYGVVVLKDDRRESIEYFRLIPQEDGHTLIQSAFNEQYISMYRGSRREGTGLICL